MLEVAMKTTIRTLFSKGYSKTKIGEILGIDRKTVRKILKEPEDKDKNKGGPWPSILDPYREFIEIQSNKGISIVRIHEDLNELYGVKCGYTTVRDYVAKLHLTQPHAYMILDSLPGEEAQVDFGYIGTLNVAGKAKKAWVFVMSLSYSRYMYAEITFDQSVKTFIRCHVDAFKFFRGVPETVKIDNLKAAIVETDFYEPTVQRTYAAFAEHYGFLPNPCRVYTPTDKGKIESNVKYVKNNCFKGRDFDSYEEAAAFLAEWLENKANKRIHGTTKKVPVEVYEAEEIAKLSPLPEDEFIFTKSEKAVVRTDCHIVYDGNLYSVPYTYIGMDVNVIEINQLLKIYYEGKEIALHTLVRNAKGEHRTDKNHYPRSKTITQEEILSRYQEQMGDIGSHALEFLEQFRNTKMYRDHHYRSISGILALARRYGDDVVDQACERACYYGNISYKSIKRICESGLYDLPIEHVEPMSIESDSKVRSLSEYRDMMGLGVIGHE